MSIQRLRDVAIAIVLLADGGAVAHAQAVPQTQPDSSVSAPIPSARHRGVLQTLAGTSAGSGLYDGWWTLHLRNTHKGIRNNHFHGAMLHGFGAGTFVTSYGDRALIATIQRYWLDGKASAFNARLGYRAGLLYGYDAELLPIAGRVPILPMTELTLDLGWKKLGMELCYAGIVVTAGAYLRM